MTYVCVKCGRVADVPAARFCVGCGWPLVQPCPYSCGAEVPLQAAAGPTARCPGCQRPFAACPDCGRLHNARATKCLNEDRTLTTTSHLWSGPSGHPTGTGWASLAGFTPGVPEPGPHIEGGAFSGLACVDGKFYYAEGGRIHLFNGAHDAHVIPDLGAPDLSEGSLIASRHSLYYAGGGNLSIVELGTHAVTTRNIKVLAHVASTNLWHGVCASPAGGLVLSVEDRTDIPLDFGPDTLLSIHAGNSAVVITEINGRSWRLKDAELTLLSAADWITVMSWLHDDTLYQLGQTRMRSIDCATGAVIHIWDFGQIQPTCAPAMCEDTGYIFFGDSQFLTFKSNGEVGARAQHGFGQVSQACGVSSPAGKAMLVVGREHSGKSVNMFRVDGGQLLAVLYRGGPSATMGFAVAENLVFVASAELHNTRVRAYAVS